MTGPRLDWSMTAVFDPRLLGQAEERVDNALAGIEAAAPVYPKANAKRQQRSKRLERLSDEGAPERGRSALIEIVAQWITAKDRAAAVPEARAAAERAALLAGEVAALQAQLARLAEALRYEGTTEAGEEVAGCAAVAASALSEALPSLRLAEDAARQMQDLMPTGARGRAGIVGALREASPDEAMAHACCRLWLACGLSTDGGEDGDGLDRFLEELLGADAARRALGAARKVVKEKL
jgi:hypothetical protein